MGTASNRVASYPIQLVQTLLNVKKLEIIAKSHEPDISYTLQFIIMYTIKNIILIDFIVHKFV